MNGHLPYIGWSPTNPRTVTPQKEVYYRPGISDLDFTIQLQSDICPESTRFNHNQPKSFLINMNQPESTQINPNQTESTWIYPDQSRSTPINFYFESTWIIPYQPKSTQVNRNEPVSTPINPNQPVPTKINPNQPVSTPIKPNQPESTWIYPYQLRIICRFKTGNGIITPTSRPLIKKLLLQHLIYVNQGV